MPVYFRLAASSKKWIFSVLKTLVKRGADSVVEALYTLFRFPEDFHLLLARFPQPDRSQETTAAPLQQHYSPPVSGSGRIPRLGPFSEG
jgi:hypothetical protein